MGRYVVDIDKYATLARQQQRGVFLSKMKIRHSLCAREIR